MSIRQEWQKLLADGELHELKPRDGDPHKRTVLLSDELHHLLTKEMPEGEEADRRARLLASLQNIVAGRRVVVALEPYSARKAVIGRLDPVEESVFDIRCQDKPAVRVFGSFLEKDVFLAVTCRPRSVRVSWVDWLPLGPRESKEWKKGIKAVKREWARYFPTEPPVCGDNLDEYLSNARLERNRRRA